MSLCILSVAYPFAAVTPDTSGGAEQVLWLLDRALHRAGHRSMVIARAGSAVHGKLITIPPPASLDDATMRRGHQRCARMIAEVLARVPVDVVHMHGVDFHAYLPPAGVPVLVTLHLPLSWYPSEALRPQRPDTWLHCVSAAQQTADTRDLHLLPPIENGVDLDGFRRCHVRRRFALMLGRICPEKGVHLAIEAAKRAAVPLVIAGELFAYEAHRCYFESEVRPHLDRLRRWVGPVGGARKRRLLAAAHCVLIPSLAEETSSLVAREAAAAGTPVVAFARGALRETIEHGRTGFLVDGLDAMAQAIHRCGEIEAEHCRTAAQARFSAEQMAAKYLRRYASLAAQVAA